MEQAITKSLIMSSMCDQFLGYEGSGQDDRHHDVTIDPKPSTS